MQLLIVQKPLQGASDSAFGAFIIALFVPFLWFFGIHGGTTVGGVPYAIMQLVIILVSALVYFPFFKKADALAYADEIEAQSSEGGVQV